MTPTQYEIRRKASIGHLESRYDELFGRPTAGRPRPVRVNGREYASCVEAAAAIGCGERALRESIRYGWPIHVNGKKVMVNAEWIT